MIVGAGRAPRWLRVYGDSTADGSGATTYAEKWYAKMAINLGTGSTEDAVPGENTTQMLARVQQQSNNTQWAIVMMDLPNTGETSATWISNVKAAANWVGNGRWFVFPPAQNVPDTGVANIAEVQALLLSDAFFSGHTFDAATQSAYLTEVSEPATRSDGTHFSDTGQTIQATYGTAFFATKLWLTE